MTVEPGVYVIGTGGIRIEDCVVIDADGATVLGHAPKDRLIEL
jgi:Xaa-Pro aminopeptidase